MRPTYVLKICFLGILFTLFSSTLLFAQVGIGATDPKTTLDVDGALSLREGTALSLSNGSNTDISLGTTPYSSYRITGPTSAFEIGSIIPETGADGQIVTFINTTDQDMTIVHTSPGGANRIYCPKETNIVLSGRYTTATFQYNLGITKWMLINSMGANVSDDWTTSGNAGTTAGTDFIGTTDTQALSIFTDNTEKLRISQGGHFRSFTDGTTTLPMFTWDTDRDTGFYRIADHTIGFTTGDSESVRIGDTETVINDDSDDYNFRVETDNDANTIFVDGGNDNVGVGTNVPAVDVKLEVNGGNTNGIFGYSNNVGGYLGRETNITIGLPGNTQSISGAGVYANNPLAGYTSVFAQSTGAATVAANVNYSDVWMANYSYVDNSNVGFNPSASYVQLNKNEASTGGDHVALKALSTREASGNPGTTIGIIAATIAGPLSGTQTEDTYGIIAQATNTATEFAIGGQFIGMGGAGGYVVNIADDYNNRKIVGTGTVSEVIPTENHGRIILTASESPEYWYQDYGSVQMANGVAIIQIDPILSDIIVVDSQNPIRVICTPYQMPYFNGVTIMKYSKTSVEIRELNGGTHSGTLQYQLVAKPKTNYGEGRFPQANGPYFTKGLELPKARTSNQHNRSNVFEWPADWEVYGYENLARQYMSGEKLIETMDNKDKK